MYICNVLSLAIDIKLIDMKEDKKLKVVHTTWGEFLKEHPVEEVVEMPDWPKGHVARVVTVNAVLA